MQGFWPRRVNWDRVDRIGDDRALACVIWSESSLELSPERFWSYFVRLYEHTDDMYCVWRAAGALRDYLRVHPGVLRVPRDLVFRMLRFRVEDASSVGFKLLVICDEMATHEIVAELVAGIRENDDSAHCCSAVFETYEFYRRVRSGERTLNAQEKADLAAALDVVAESNPWDMLRGMGRSSRGELLELI